MSWNFPYLVITRADVEKYATEEDREQALKEFGMWTQFDEDEKKEKETEETARMESGGMNV